MGTPDKVARGNACQVWQHYDTDRCHLQDYSLRHTLIFVTVRTNVGYTVAAEFIVQSETNEDIEEALGIMESTMETIIFHVRLLRS